MSYLGVVKTYNSNRKYGFISLWGSVHNDENGDIVVKNIQPRDIFVHESALCPAEATHPNVKLYTGEFVQFELDEGKNKGEYAAVNVGGIFGRRLLCDNGKFIFKRVKKKENTHQSPPTTPTTPSPMTSRERSRSSSPINLDD